MLTLIPIVWTVRTGLKHEQYGEPYDCVAMCHCRRELTNKEN